MRSIISSLIVIVSTSGYLEKDLLEMVLVWFFQIFVVSGGFGTNRGPIRKPRAFPSSNITQEMPLIIKRTAFVYIFTSPILRSWSQSKIRMTYLQGKGNCNSNFENGVFRNRAFCKAIIFLVRNFKIQ